MERSSAGEVERWREIAALIEMSDRARAHLDALTTWMWANVAARDCVPRQLPPDLAAIAAGLGETIAAIRQQGREISERLLLRPIQRLMAGRKLTREEYYLLAAVGLLERGMRVPEAAEWDDYELFMMFWYENDQHRCYINPQAAVPRDPGDRIRLSFGRPPEELRLGSLRPEQANFFRRFPELYARFRS